MELWWDGTPGNFNRSKVTADKLYNVNAAVQVVSSFSMGEKHGSTGTARGWS